MIKLILTALLFLIFSNSHTQTFKDLDNTNGYDLNYKDPNNVVNGIIHAIKKKDSLLLYFLTLPAIDIKGFEHHSFIKAYNIPEILKIKNIYVTGKFEYTSDSLQCKIPLVIVESKTRESYHYFKKVYGNWYWDGEH